MARHLSTAYYVHLAVDLQSDDLSRLHARRGLVLPQAVNNLAASLKHAEIPTIWVAISGMCRMYSRFLTQPMHRNVDRSLTIQSLKLDAVSIDADDDIFVKDDCDAFYKSLLVTHLHRYYPKAATLILTGVNTTACVAASVAGALKAGFKCIVLTDCLADSEEERERRYYSKWHERQLRMNVIKNLCEIEGWSLSRVVNVIERQLVCTHSKNLPNIIEMKPASPRRTKPVHQYAALKAA